MIVGVNKKGSMLESRGSLRHLKILPQLVEGSQTFYDILKQNKAKLNDFFNL